VVVVQGSGLDFGIDPSSVDPRRILAAIAADPTVPASSRVLAARALMDDTGTSKEAKADASKDRVSKRAVELLRLVK
jgi:hypothetical protein